MDCRNGIDSDLLAFLRLSLRSMLLAISKREVNPVESKGIPCYIDRMRPFLFAVILIVPMLSTGKDPHPNVVFFMADDMGMGDTSAYQDYTGNSDSEQIHTPGMERLAALGTRFTDAHTPSSRCTATRYGLMTGRYPFRTRLKHYVLFGSQGDPLIEPDRPTLATLFRGKGYSTVMVGKWHVGLRYRKSDGSPAAAWEDADLTQTLFDSPIDHGFDICRFTSRSHGTSGTRGKKNGPSQSVGPGHIDGRMLVSATGNGKELMEEGPQAYDLNALGARHSDNAMQFLQNHVMGEDSWEKPFFLYYASNSNHSPYTPSEEIGGVKVVGEGKSVSGSPMGQRYDYVYENDVALNRLISFLEETEDRRREGKRLIENTIVIFTSDNGAEIKDKSATGPYRSNKGSGYEGGHRVPFIVSWPVGAVKAKATSGELLGLTDMFATFSEVLGEEVPNGKNGKSGGEDSFSVLAAWRGEGAPPRPLFHNDHKEGEDPAATGFRLDDPEVDGKVVEGNWKIFFTGDLIRFGKPKAVELYDLATDPKEEVNRIEEKGLEPLVQHLVAQAIDSRLTGGTRIASEESRNRRMFVRWNRGEVAEQTGEDAGMTIAVERDGKQIGKPEFDINPRGLGVAGGKFGQVDNGEALLITFEQDVFVETVGVVAGNGTCGGFYQIGDRAPLAIYCTDADNDSKDQHGLISDLGLLKKGEVLRLDSSPHFGVEAPGQWRLSSLSVRMISD